MASAVESESPLDQLFSDLRYETVDTVMTSISLESPLRKCDWRALAGILGFSDRQIRYFEQDKRIPCKGRHLINVWEDLGKSSLRKLIFALKDANMMESLRVIMKDEDLEDVDFEAVIQEYKHLKSEKLLRKQIFPRIPMEKFQQVFYRSSIPMPHSENVWDSSPPCAASSTPSCATNSAPSCAGPVETEIHRYTSVPCDFDNAYAPTPQRQPPLDPNSVFISFCPESGLTNRKFNNQLRRFAEFIQNQGFTLHFEPNSQAEIRRCGGVIIWKEACIKKSKNIIVVCTPEYYKEDCKATETISVRRSVSKIEMESRLLRQLAYSQADSARIIPVILDSRKPTRNQLPIWVQPLVTHTWPSGERDLDLCLRDQPRFVLPKIDPSKKKVIKPIVIDFPDARKHRC